MGCAFNMYSSAWSDRSYGLTLFFYCWIFPLLIIFCSYIGIIYHTRISGEKLLISSTSGRKSEIGKDFTEGRKHNGTLNKNASPSPKRASINIINIHYKYLYSTTVYSWHFYTKIIAQSNALFNDALLMFGNGSCIKNIHFLLV